MTDKPDAAYADLSGSALVTIIEDGDMPPYQRRVVQEANELAGNMDRLTAFLAKHGHTINPIERERMRRQLGAQSVLLSILNERIRAFKP